VNHSELYGTGRGQFKELHNFHKVTDENHEKSQGSRSSGQHSNLRPPEYGTNLME